MNTMSEQSLSNLSAALVAASAEMPAVAFDENNPFLGNRFASLGSVIATVRPILAKHGLAVMQFACSDPQGRIGVRTRLVHSSGEYMEDVIYMDIFEDKDTRKSKAQVAGSIITYLRRYAQSALLNLYADEDTDGNRLTPAEQAASGEPQQRTGRVQAHKPSPTPVLPTKTPAIGVKALGEAKGSASPKGGYDAEKCKARTLQVIAEKQWELYAWLYAVRNGWILNTERLEDARPDKFPATAEGFAGYEVAIKKLIDDASPVGISQEDQEAYDKAHYEPSDNDGGANDPEEDDSWKDLEVPKWSKHFKEDGAITFGDLDSKQLWWWCCKWQPTGYKGKPPKAEDMELRRQLDNVRSLMNFTE